MSPPLGIITTASIVLHELVQELSKFFVLREGRFSTPLTLSINFLVSSTVLLGVIFSYTLLEFIHALEGPLLGITAGAFLIMVVHDLVPHSVHSSVRTKNYWQNVSLFMLRVSACLLLP